MISNCDQINRSNLNNSPAKQLYSFTKTERFKMPEPNCKRISYEASQKFGRSYFPVHSDTTFGVQRPILFHSKEINAKPSPVMYTLPTQFEDKRSNSSQK